MTPAPRLVLGSALVALAVSGCHDSVPTAPTAGSTIRFSRLSPSGTVVTITGAAPGAFIERGSGQLEVGVQVQADRQVPWAQLSVYLLSADGYCAQNLPDAPTWAPFPMRQIVGHTVTGFQVYRLPCDVNGIHAVLHTRNSGVLTPPAGSEIVAEAFSLVTYHLRP